MIIGLSGLAGSGKSTVAKYLANDRDCYTLALADPMKEFCQKIFEFSDEQLWGPSEYRNAVDLRYKRDRIHYLTPRHALQTLGTEWGRACYEDVWVDYGIRRAKNVLWNYPDHYPAVVIEDIRFQNELAAVRRAGGEVWRIVRPGTEGLVGEAAQHASENDIQEGDCDRIILNKGSLEDLRKIIQEVQW